MHTTAVGSTFGRPSVNAPLTSRRPGSCSRPAEARAAARAVCASGPPPGAVAAAAPAVLVGAVALQRPREIEKGAGAAGYIQRWPFGSQWQQPTTGRLAPGWHHSVLRVRGEVPKEQKQERVDWGGATRNLLGCSRHPGSGAIGGCSCCGRGRGCRLLGVGRLQCRLALQACKRPTWGRKEGLQAEAGWPGHARGISETHMVFNFAWSR